MKITIINDNLITEWAKKFFGTSNTKTIMPTGEFQCPRCGSYHGCTCHYAYVGRAWSNYAYVGRAWSTDRQQEIIDELKKITDLLERLLNQTPKQNQ